ncbi:hypothetical protein [Rhizobium leguminosarum]|uniref:hypothetical protein n=1 Tax=Rhizobium leguminosarum TaxID=384 RepID=UPI00140FCA24|nr:hypothetical protein [Rhizobium leguminosarum]QIO60656.1 hypothetical protein HA463_24355 [Rhizobium leguminosarum bv. trifolii]
MLEQRGNHDGDFAVREPVVTYGIINGNVTVPSGQEIVIRGIINGDLFIGDGGTAKVHGMINGSVRNLGKVWIYGIIGNLYEDASAETHVDAKAMIAGKDHRLA